MARSPFSPKELPHPGKDARSPVSGTQRLGLTSLRTILRRYISPIMLDSVLDRAIANHAAEKLPANDLLKLVTADCMIGLRLFVKPTQLPDLMLELAELLERGE